MTDAIHGRTTAYADPSTASAAPSSTDPAPAHLAWLAQRYGRSPFTPLETARRELGVDRAAFARLLAAFERRPDLREAVLTGPSGAIPRPSPTGAIPMADDAGNFRYDVALMETNRGCPYKCSFCYWGGAVGQKMRSFSAERLAAELDLFGYLDNYEIAAQHLATARRVGPLAALSPAS